MPVSKCFSKEVKDCAEENGFTILYDSYLKTIILYDELEKTQYELYVKEQRIKKSDGSFRQANDSDIDKFALEAMQIRVVSSLKSKVIPSGSILKEKDKETKELLKELKEIKRLIYEERHDHTRHLYPYYPPYPYGQWYPYYPYSTGSFPDSYYPYTWV